MNRRIMATLVILAAWTIVLGGCKKETPEKTESTPPVPVPAATSAPSGRADTGETLFKQHCAVCHPDGGNIVKPDYTLHSKALKGHNIVKPDDIVKKIRNPGPGMNKFDEKTIPDKDALMIAEYVLNTFK